jgi:hypothetical protein
MSYHLTILRTDRGKHIPISLDQALAAAQSLGNWRYVATPPSFEHAGAEGLSTVYFQKGELWTSNPEPCSIAPMLALARQLDARLRGDEFETYESADKTFLHPDDVQLRKAALAQSTALRADSMREQRLIRNVIVGFFLVLGALGYLVGKWFEGPAG